jgi:hypothetical protein
MIIRLSQSALFTEDPSTRFAKEYGVDESVWSEMWRRKLALEYTDEDLCDYLHIKMGRRPSIKTIQRWAWRVEVYNRARIALEKGAECVVSDFFEDNEMEVIRELTKHVKDGFPAESLP